MVKLFLYNTLTRQKEEFKPIPHPSPRGSKGEVGIYTCGPTVYNYPHVGNLRTYLFEDILKRVLLYNGYEVKHVMNITDVGHLTGDMDMGEDKIEKGAKREGKTAWEIAEFYTNAFKEDLRKLNILEPNIWCKATDNIPEQIDLIKKLEARGYTYKTSDGIYYDTAKFREYNKLSHLDLATLREGARVEKNKEKKNPTDFALWKFSIPHPNPLFSKEREIKGKRQMEWNSPWGVGFPGWHIECSAMSMKFLGEQFAIHCGGIDHINIHHTNEIAQSEAATGKNPWVKYWLHGAFLNISGGVKMAKSAENFLTLENAFIKKGINPLVYRFACLQTHYRKPMEYSEKAMLNAKQGLEHLYNQIRELRIKNYPATAGPRQGGGELRINDKLINKKYKGNFIKAINNDLNMPKALAVAQELLKSNLSPKIKLATIKDLDKILGLDLFKIFEEKKIPKIIDDLLKRRNKAREGKDFSLADSFRKEIEKQGYLVEDTKDGQRVIKK